MKPNEKKLKRSMTAPETAAIFRRMAKVLEGNGPAVEDPVEGLLADFSKATIKLKRKGGRITFKAKAETADGPTAAAGTDAPEPIPATETPRGSDPAKPKYKALKKRMKSTFGRIGDSLAEDRLPDGETVTAFLTDSKLMVTYPGYGDPFYGDYSEACRRLASAFDDRRWGAFKEAYLALRRLKSDCHDRFK